MTAIFQASILLSFVLFQIPKDWKYSVSFILHILLIFATVNWALTAFTLEEALPVPMGISTWSGEIVLVIDKLSAFFILVVDLICFAGIIYAGGYLKMLAHNFLNFQHFHFERE